MAKARLSGGMSGCHSPGFPKWRNGSNKKETVCLSAKSRAEMGDPSVDSLEVEIDFMARSVLGWVVFIGICCGSQATDSPGLIPWPISGALSTIWMSRFTRTWLQIDPNHLKVSIVMGVSSNGWLINN